MNNKLVYTSDSMNVFIKNYVESKFKYNNWVVSDKYEFNEKSPRHSHYSILVTSPMISNEQELCNYESYGRDIANKITSFIPLCVLLSLINKGTHDFLTNKSIIVFESAPNGWKTNYREVRKELTVPNNEIYMEIECLGVTGYSILDNSPMKELQIMLEKYNDIKDEVKYLIFLNDSILSSTNSNIFMLMGKALEIINAMYPLKTKKDRRIEEHFPELTSVFNSYTIKDLMNLSNNRKETRHYIKDKAKLISHESLNEEERIMMYKCTICLITNVLREQLGLPRVNFTFA